jgi:hypothetical protein
MKKKKQPKTRLTKLKSKLKKVDFKTIIAIIKLVEEIYHFIKDIPQ